jgi:hypothetical protein
MFFPGMKCVDERNDSNVREPQMNNFTLGDSAAEYKKGFFSHEKLLFYENQKRKKRERENTRRKELFIAIVVECVL